ncbi:MAG: hypothetical protein ACRC92_09250 [Peptostreptococcaceae bacterium]
MTDKKRNNLFKIMLWREVFVVPAYTILFNNSAKLFWIVFAIDRMIVLLMGLKSVDMEEVIDSIFDSTNRDERKLVIFSLISSITLYILTLINNKQLFYILIGAEIADYIVLKLVKD